MKKVLVLLALVLGVSNMYAQDYDLEGLAKACNESKEVSSFHEGLAAIRKDGKWGFMDKTGKIVIPTIYSSARDFHEGLAAVSKDGKSGYIDKEGNVILPFNFQDASDFIGGYANVVGGEDSVFFCVIDKMGIPIPLEGYDFGKCSDGLFRVTSYENDKCGYVDAKGQAVIPFLYDSAFDFEEGVAKVIKNDKYGFIDKSGRIVIPFNEDENSVGRKCSGGLISFQKIIGSDYFYGFRDKQGRVAIPCELDNVSDFHEGLAWVQWASWRGFIDINGKKVLECKYYFKSGFNEGIAVIQDEDNYGYINRAGQIIAPLSFDEVNDFSEGLGLVKKGRRYGYIDKSGNSTFNFSIVQPSTEEEIGEETDVNEDLPMVEDALEN